MRVESVTIESFKGLRHFEIAIGSFDCLVGPNNSGKSTVLQAIAFFDFCVKQCMRRRRGRLALEGRSIPPEEFVAVPLATPRDLWTDRRYMANRKQIYSSVAVRFDNDVEVTAAARLNFNRFSLTVSSSEPSEEWLGMLQQFQVSYLPVFSSFLAQEERRYPVSIQDELAHGRVNRVVRNLLLDLKEAGRLDDLVGILQRTFPSLANFEVVFDEVNDRYITVSYREGKRACELDVFSAGSGFQQFVYLFGFILLRQPTLVLLDEPDVHLHGTLQRALLQELRTLVSDGKQVLLATHSRDTVSQMEPESIVYLERDIPPRRLSVAFDKYDVLDRLGALDVSQLPALQAHGRVLVVENSTDWKLLACFLAKTSGTAVCQQVERRLALCYSRSNPCRQDIPLLKQQIQQVVGEAGERLEVFVIADRDYHPAPGDLHSSLASDGIRWHVWERAEIENYLLVPDAIIRLAGKAEQLPPLLEEAVRSKLEELVEESRDSAHDHLVEAFKNYGRESDERWDPVTMSRKAREFLRDHWEGGKRSLADAKEVVLPGIKRYLQENSLSQFSNLALAEEIHPEELPNEISEVCDELAQFAGVAFERSNG